MTSLTFGAVSLWLMRKYLERLGATDLGDDVYELRGATIKIGPGEPLKVATIKLNRIQVDVDAPDKELEASVVADIRLKAMRGGG